jgi:hypothetical protein
MIIVACPCSQTGTFTQPHASQTKPEHAGALAGTQRSSVPRSCFLPASCSHEATRCQRGTAPIWSGRRSVGRLLGGAGPGTCQLVGQCYHPLPHDCSSYYWDMERLGVFRRAQTNGAGGWGGFVRLNWTDSSIPMARQIWVTTAKGLWEYSQYGDYGSCREGKGRLAMGARLGQQRDDGSR